MTSVQKAPLQLGKRGGNATNVKDTKSVRKLTMDPQG